MILKIYNWVKLIGSWILFSSTNPQKVSTTIKGILGFVVTGLTMWAGFANVQLPTADITTFVDIFIQGVQSTLLVVSSVATAYGLIRKILITIKGEHPALQKEVNE